MGLANRVRRFRDVGWRILGALLAIGCLGIAIVVLWGIVSDFTAGVSLHCTVSANTNASMVPLSCVDGRTAILQNFNNDRFAEGQPMDVHVGADRVAHWVRWSDSLIAACLVVGAWASWVLSRHPELSEWKWRSPQATEPAA